MWTVQALSSCDPSVTSLFLENGFQRVLGRVKIVVQCQGHSNWFYGVQMQFQMDFNVSKWRAVLLAVLVATGAYKEVSFWVLLGFGLFLFFPFFYIYIFGDVWVYVWVYTCVWTHVYIHLRTYLSKPEVDFIYLFLLFSTLFVFCLFVWLIGWDCVWISQIQHVDQWAHDVLLFLPPSTGFDRPIPSCLTYSTGAGKSNSGGKHITDWTVSPAPGVVVLILAVFTTSLFRISTLIS